MAGFELIADKEYTGIYGFPVKKTSFLVSNTKTTRAQTGADQKHYFPTKSTMLFQMSYVSMRGNQGNMNLHILEQILEEKFLLQNSLKESLTSN